jgi:hypothetical protein
MNAFVIDPSATAATCVDGSGLFPVRRIFCVGLNYAVHAREMRKDLTYEPLFFSMKPADSIVTGCTDTSYPPATQAPLCGSFVFMKRNLLIGKRSTKSGPAPFGWGCTVVGSKAYDYV